MAEPLKNLFDEDVIDRIAQMFVPHAPDLDWNKFCSGARHGYRKLELLPRARHIADCLATVLPRDFPAAVELLIASLGPAHEVEQNSGMASFVYLPHCLYVAKYGIEHFEAAMRANYELTKRFSAEFSIRPFIARYPQASLRLLEQWVEDPNVHVRRLVSEGTRPRLPWAGRLSTFADSPSTMILLLERLRDDPHEYVRRSVANHLNDIGKDHPQLLIKLCARWMQQASADRRRLIGHALRSLIKQGHADALRIMGFSAGVGLSVGAGKVSPKRALIGASAKAEFTVLNNSRRSQPVLVDLRVHYVKADGTSSPKVFKHSEFELAAGEARSLSYKLSFRQMTTRTHYPGRHRIEALVNGKVMPVAEFSLIGSAAG